jgi:tungstate transport system permease protein
MQDHASAFSLAVGLVRAGDPDLVQIVLLSLAVSLSAVAVACVIGLPLAALLAVSRFPGRGAVVLLLNALMGLPPVVVGLAVYLALSRAGPLGALGLLYSPAAMVIAQVILITPIVAAIARQILEEMHRDYAPLFASLMVGRARATAALMWDARVGLVTAALAGFGRSIAEVGAVIIVGGNIDHLTRVMTTAIALETSKGNLALAMALGMILLAIALAVNAAISAVGLTVRRTAHG